MRRALSLAVGLALLASACSGGSEETAPSTAAPAPTPAPTAAPVPTTASPPTTAVPSPPATTAPPPPTTSTPTTTSPPPTTAAPIPCEAAEGEAPEDPVASSLPEAISARGVVRIGVINFDFPPIFSCSVDGNYQGLEAAIARLLVEGTLGEVEIAWVGLTPANRFDMVREEAVDFAIRNTTVTPGRRDLVDFTTPISHGRTCRHRADRCRRDRPRGSCRTEDRCCTGNIFGSAAHRGAHQRGDNV